MYGASKNLSFVHFRVHWLPSQLYYYAVPVAFSESKPKKMANSDVKYRFRSGISAQNSCPEPSLNHIDPEIKNYEILKDRGAETKVTPHSTVTSFLIILG